MRTIKFRWFHKKSGKMADWNTTLKECDRLSFLLPSDDWVVMQYTGLLDKNGKEIYEGDIVKGGKSYYIEEVVGVVKYGGLAFAYAGKTASGKEWFNTITSPNCTKDVSIEVIGNIYETPELLEVNNE